MAEAARDAAVVRIPLVELMALLLIEEEEEAIGERMIDFLSVVGL